MQFAIANKEQEGTACSSCTPLLPKRGGKTREKEAAELCCCLAVNMMWLLLPDSRSGTGMSLVKMAEWAEACGCAVGLMMSQFGVGR